MKTDYIAPLTEILEACIENIMIQDTTGFQDPGEVDANVGSFDEGEDLQPTKGLWED